LKHFYIDIDVISCNLFTKSLYIFLICSYTVSCQKRQETRKKNKRVFLVETRSKNSEPTAR